MCGGTDALNRVAFDEVVLFRRRCELECRKVDGLSSAR